MNVETAGDPKTAFAKATNSAFVSMFIAQTAVAVQERRSIGLGPPSTDSPQ